MTSVISAIPVTSGESFALHKVRTSWDGTDGDNVTTVEQNRTTRTEAAEIMPFGGWESTPATAAFGDHETLFRFPAADDPAPSPARLLTMALYASALGLAGVGVGLRAMVKLFGGTPFWYVPTLSLFGLLSVALVVGSFLSIHRPVLPWLLLAAAAAPLAIDILIAVFY
ncbi:hypothetical protein Ato02nite_076010 [Paractinoplanes toevensis]|uniref:Uncharacterized protein n=1 Tax=Paractinoplanes toevensis TaxID=571911 RepID=A0A919W8Z2_9ACTN|nr:hypothetical protein Ato02nite_076010 [Actinoplanes toevensis]